MEGIHANDGEEVTANTADLCAHLVEQMAQLLDIGFAGGIVDGGGALGKDGSHDDVGRTRYRSLIEQHVTALELVGMNLIDIPLLVEIELRTEVFEAKEVRVQTAPSNLVTTRLSHHSLAVASQQWTDHQYAASQSGTFTDELIALQVVEVQVGGLEGVLVSAPFVHLHANLLQ